MSHFALAKVVYRRVPSAGTANVPERSNKVSMSTLMHFPTLPPPHYSPFSYIFFFLSFISLYIQRCGSQQRSNAPFGAVPQTQEV